MIVLDSALTDTSDLDANRKHKLKQLKYLYKQQELQKQQQINKPSYQTSSGSSKKSCIKCNQNNNNSKANQMINIRKITKSLEHMNMLSGSRQSMSSTVYDHNNNNNSKSCSSCKICLLTNIQNQQRTKTINKFDMHSNANNVILNQIPVQQQTVPPGATQYFVSHPNGEIIYCDASGRILGMPPSTPQKTYNVHSRSTIALNTNQQYINEIDPNFINVMRHQQMYSSQNKLNNYGHPIIHQPSLSSVQMGTENAGVPIGVAQTNTAVQSTPTTQIYSSKSSGLNYIPQQQEQKNVTPPQPTQTYSLPQNPQIYAPFIPIQKPVEQLNSQNKLLFFTLIYIFNI